MMVKRVCVPCINILERKKVILQSNRLLAFWTVKMSPFKLAEIKRCQPFAVTINVFSLLFPGCLPAVRMYDNHSESNIYRRYFLLQKKGLLDIKKHLMYNQCNT